MRYNLQGRLSELTITTTNAQGQVTKVTQEYVYDESGIKIRQTETADTNNDGVAETRSDTTYINDHQNQTGYSQVLEEHTTVTNADGTGTKVTTYTIGHDVLSQFSNAMRSDIAAAGGEGASLFYLYDAHGSNRGVTDSTGQTVLQAYHYDAYGNAIGFAPANSLTTLLYSGEQFNPTSGLQYLRARWYNPTTGTFNRLDPFAGDIQSPLSLQKYAYTHNNPVMGIDPTGEFLWILIPLLSILTLSGMYLYGKYGASSVSQGSGTTKLYPMPRIPGIGNVQDNGSYVDDTIESLYSRNRTIANAIRTSNRSVIFNIMEDTTEVLAIAVTVLNEPSDWFATINDACKNGLSWSHGLALLPFVPGTAGRVVRKIHFDEIVDHSRVSSSQLLDMASGYLGPNYREISSGVFISADGTRMVRMAPRDLAGHSGMAPHLNFETVIKNTEYGGRTTYSSTGNKHVYFTD